MIIENENVNRKYEKLFQDFKLAKADNMQIKEENSNLIFDNKRLKESSSRRKLYKEINCGRRRTRRGVDN